MKEFFTATDSSVITICFVVSPETFFLSQLDWSHSQVLLDAHESIEAHRNSLNLSKYSQILMGGLCFNFHPQETVGQAATRIYDIFNEDIDFDYVVVAHPDPVYAQQIARGLEEMIGVQKGSSAPVGIGILDSDPFQRCIVQQCRLRMTQNRLN